MMGMILFSLVLLLAAGIFTILFLIRKMLKKEALRIGRLAVLCLTSGMIVFCFSLGELQSGLIMLGVCLVLCAGFLFIIGLVRFFRRKGPRYLFGAGSFLILGITAILVACIALKPHSSIDSENHEIHEEIISLTTRDFEVVDQKEPIEIVDYTQSINGEYLSVYDAAHLNLLYDEVDLTAKDCIRVLQENEEIGEMYKTFFEDFIKRIEKKYPDFPYATLYQNLKTLKVEKLSGFDYVFKALSISSLGCYRRDENIIYIPEGTEYIEGEFGFQVLLHEFCHAVRGCRVDGDHAHQALFCYDVESELLEECLNSVFSCSLLSYDERDIAYQVPSNYLRIMLECMDNYEILDYMRYGDTYFYRMLDESSGYTNYSSTIWKLITLQREDWQSEKIDLPSEEYDPIYDFLCELYYKKYITSDMTEKEMIAVADELVEKAFYDAPEDYKVNKERFYDNLEKSNFVQ